MTNPFFQIRSINDFTLERWYFDKYNLIPSEANLGALSIAALKYCYTHFDCLFGAFDFRNNIQKQVEQDNERFGFYPKSSNETIFFLDSKTQTVIRVSVEDTESLQINLYNSNQLHFKEFAELFKQFIISQDILKIGFLLSAGGGVEIKRISLPKMTIDLGLNYGQSFIEKHQDVVYKLGNQHSGLYLFYGKAGTGKTSYIKYLASQVRRPFIFIPSNQINSLVSPDFLSLLFQNPNSVLVLEDAEQAVVSREDNPDSSLASTILNLSDGILGTALNTSLIVTFNQNRDDIDKALVRKGRLKVEHDFNSLSKEDSQHLLDSLKIDMKATSSMTLAEIYNIKEENFHVTKEKKAMGF